MLSQNSVEVKITKKQYFNTLKIKKKKIKKIKRDKKEYYVCIL